MGSEFQEKENLREHFRIVYRPGDAPVFETGKVKYVVIDISEGGLRFVPKKDDTFAEQGKLEGKIIFGDKSTLPIHGVIIRVTKTDVAMQLESRSRIPLAKIMDEQRQLIKKGKL